MADTSSAASPPVGFWNVARQTPERVLLVGPGHDTRTAGELFQAANRIVHALREMGVGHDDVVASFWPNGIPTIELFLASLQGGFFVASVNTRLAPSEVAYIVRDSGAKALFTSATLGETAIAAVAEAGLPAEAVFSVGGLDGFRTWESLTDGQPATEPEDRRAGGLMNYTSGTTGRPKGVKRPMLGFDPEQQGELGALAGMVFGLPSGPGQVHLATGPLYHTAVLGLSAAALHNGQTLVLMDDWTPEGTLERIDRYKVTTSHMVPTMFHRLLALPDEVKARYDVSSLTNVLHGAAPCPVATKEAMLDWFGPVIYEYYGATEGGGTLATPEDARKKPGTVGKPWFITELSIRDDDGNEVPTGEPGNIWIKMMGQTFAYHGDEEKTRNAWSGEFFSVGDVGYLDEDGYLFICDRKSDFIISGGVNIYPAEIEAVLHEHPSVADVAVFGVPNDEWGEEIKAVVEPAAGAGPDGLAAELLEHCQPRLAKFKLPRSIDVVDQLPRDLNGKLAKRRLREPYWAGRDRQV